jgi:hypothetical protein
MNAATTVRLLVLVVSWSAAMTAALSRPSLITNRRVVIASGLMGGSLEAASTAAVASTDKDAGESIRRGASNLPGYGPSDVFYPPTFRGKWNVKREIVDQKTVEYEMRFIVSSNAMVVADRGFNEAAFERAISSIGIQSYEWTETNPNDLRLIREDGSRKEIKVTKRSSEQADDFVSSSEFQRITTEDAVRRIPVITAQRVLTKWKIVSDSDIEGLEIIYDMGGAGDPLAGASTASGPTLLSKSRLHLKRMQ